MGNQTVRKTAMAVTLGLLVTGFLGFLAGCASAPISLADSNVSPHMSVVEARQAFPASIKGAYALFFNGAHKRRVAVRGASLATDGTGVDLKLQHEQEPPFTRKFRPQPEDILIAEGGPAGYLVFHKRAGAKRSFDRFILGFSLKTLDDAKRFADAWYVLGHATPEEIVASGKKQAQAEEDAFVETVVKPHRSQTVKPEIPEETHKYSVQAEFAMDHKQYEQAADLYGEGLKITPWWAHGRFNRALMLAETNQFAEAVAEMKKYLALEPDSSDARAARDKIYQWEMESRSGQSGQAEHANASR